MSYFSTFRAPYLGIILDPFWAIFRHYWISLKWCSGNNWSKITNDRTECVFILVHFTVFGHFCKQVYFEVFWTPFETHFRHLIYAIILMYLGPYLGIILDPFMVGKSCHKSINLWPYMDTHQALDRVHLVWLLKVSTFFLALLCM